LVSLANLTDLGFRRGVVSETIVSTYNPDGSADAAPMGLKLLDEVHLGMNVFNTSSTCRNLKAKKCAVVNLTCDIEVFYKSAFKDANPDGKIPAEWFVTAQAVDAPKLQSAEATVEVSVDSVSSDGEQTQFSCSMKRLVATAQFPQVYCRALPLTVEAIIHATRVKAFFSIPEKQKEATDLLELIKNYAQVVGRVAPDSEYTTVMTNLLGRIDSWRLKP
jgi:hypothetical protein